MNALKILTVEDDSEHAEVIRRAFEPANGSVRLSFAGSLKEARNLLQKFKPDLVIADWFLPDGVATELIDKPKEQRSLPLILMTAQGDEHMAVEAIKSGALDYVVKTEASLKAIPRVAQRALREWALILEKQRAEEEKKGLEAQLRHAQRLETIGTLAGGIAHDFNNILQPMLVYTDLVRRQLPVGSRSRKDLDRVLTGIDRAKDLIDQILAFSRQFEQERCLIDLPTVINEAMELVRATLPSSIEIRQKIVQTNCSIQADSRQIEQVILNLCTNAYHALRDEGGLIEITLEAQSQVPEQATRASRLKCGTPYALLKVRDNGVGMDARTRERVFEPFFTTKRVGEGSGLGLSVVHGIVTSHDGDIFVHSRTGEGTTFEVFFPINQNADGQAENEAPLRQRDGESILFVDDENDVAEMGRRVLEEYDFAVTVTLSSAEALKLVSAEPERFDLVITDKTMPVLGGYQLARRLKTLRPDLPVLMMSGWQDRCNVPPSAENCVDAFIAKPFDLNQLLKGVTKLLGRGNQGLEKIAS